jgi:hypothetical protein
MISFESSKTTEEKEREMVLEARKQELDAYMKNLIDEKDKINKDRIKEKMIDIKDEVEYLNKENMDEQKFWGMLALNNEDVFDYGRDILKDGTYETTMMLPYNPYPLFTKTDWFKSELHKPVV